LIYEKYSPNYPEGYWDRFFQRQLKQLGTGYEVMRFYSFGEEMEVIL
jgi:hypothetical protein